ncbi:CAZyme family GH3 [Penicillium alfredii]|uniref:Probable beta-glucosidase E n=1 Tax=Penicillium alfredii TaxID=1506179 RepID=A0A9W9F2L0_9EURO|nr:CAZyme family GH3 [Penicillium alfredii]KAJ5092457.1 CAZyme family GH3 [Penicillium alfredii]
MILFDESFIDPSPIRVGQVIVSPVEAFGHDVHASGHQFQFATFRRPNLSHSPIEILEIQQWAPSIALPDESMASPASLAGPSRLNAEPPIHKKPRNSKARRNGYSSLGITEEYDTQGSVGSSHRGQRAQLSSDDSDATPSSGDESLAESEAHMKLLPLKMDSKSRSAQYSAHQSTPRHDPSPAPSNGSAEPRDVGKRIEQVLQTEDALDMEEGNPLTAAFDLSDDDSDDYGLPSSKTHQGTRRHSDGFTCGSGWRPPFRMQKWWHAFPFAVIGLLVMWLAAKGIGWTFAKTTEVEYRSMPWYPTPRGGTSVKWNESYSKAQDLVKRMSLTEKVNVTTGIGWEMGPCVGNTGPAELVGFPSLCLQDGPLGLRFADNITAFPAGITTGATWNRELMQARGAALGQEARRKGVNVLVGPSMGPLGLMPAGGRNWEAFGSDPVLQGIAAAETIRGIQRHGVMATAKHYVLNEQEHFRTPQGESTALSSNINDRVLHEVFIWPFAESVRADVASIMCSYQMVNNSYACENSKLLNGILKDELGFQGFVQSDWLAQHSGVHSALGGLDMSMPGDGLRWADGDSLWGSRLTRAALNTSVPMERLNDMVTRIVAAWYHFRQDSWDPPPPEGHGGPSFSSWTKERIGRLHPGSPDNKDVGEVNKFVNAAKNGTESHSTIARKVAAEGIVLLKNVNNTLPLSREVSSANGKYRIGVYGDDAGPGRGPNACPDRGCNQGTLASGWGSGAVEFPYLISPWEALQSAWSADTIDLQGYLTSDVTLQDLQDRDLCLVFANSDGGEGYIQSEGIAGDRNDLFLQHNGAQLVETVAQNCGGGHGSTVVILHSIGPVILDPWIDLPGVQAVVYANLPGQESGNGLVDVLFGDVDASGRLPYTIGRTSEDYGPGAQVVYESHDSTPQVDLNQGLYIDYRYFDRHNITPRFEFGFGLSYTSFNLSALRIESLQKKSRLPSPRPKNKVEPPSYDNQRSNPLSTLVPAGFRMFRKYIYPYLESLSGTEPGPYPYPEGYSDVQQPSAAGGGIGGNPSLFEPMVSLSVDVTNTGSRTGQEVVQIYVSFPKDIAEHRGLGWSRETIDFPERALRNFSKVSLQPGETAMVNMTLSRKDLSYWSVRAQNWLLPTEGKFRIWAGRSSRDLPLVADYFWIGGKAQTYCPEVVKGCRQTNDTLISGQNSLDVEVPGGQRIYVDPKGALRFTTPHSAYEPAGSSDGIFKYTTGKQFGHWTYTGQGASGFKACLVAAKNTTQSAWEYV